MSQKSNWPLKLSYTEFIVLISMLMALTALSIDAMLPANPEITADCWDIEARKITTHRQHIFPGLCDFTVILRATC